MISYYTKVPDLAIFDGIYIILIILAFIVICLKISHYLRVRAIEIELLKYLIAMNKKIEEDNRKNNIPLV